MNKEITRLFDFAYHQLATNPQAKCFNTKVVNKWIPTSTEQYLEKANTISRALLKLGVKPNDKIAVVTSKNRVEWSILDVAVLQIGAINVPLYPTISSSDYQYIINHSDAVLCFVSDKELADKVLKIKDKTQIKDLYSFDEIKNISTWNSLLKLGDNLKEVKPHFIPVVPRLLEKIYDKIIDKGSNLKPLKRILFFWSLNLGKQYKPYHENGWWYHFKLKIANKLVFSKWREALGGNIKFLVSGSAPLQPILIKVFTAANIPVFEGYGMTETSPCISINDFRNGGFKIGSVGKILEDVEVKIASDGEILVKGSNIMMGYFKEPELTKQTIINDYLHTGDIGELDNDGFLKITDRKKEMFKTSGGKYIAPAVLESKLRESRFIEQAMVIGESEKMPAAIIQPNFEFLIEWIKRKELKIDISSNKAIISNKKVIKRIRKEIVFANNEFGNWEKIKDFELTSEIWSIENGLLTPTMKIKRKSIILKYKYLYNEIYQKQN
ncbi:MAG: long-chain fatty acid--CoA ligase [Flavobacteriaceae bacterium]|nr:MAG: long-chain fatty acid--CoA ligase [Flavobacteriaceae bacterium]